MSILLPAEATANIAETAVAALVIIAVAPKDTQPTKAAEAAYAFVSFGLTAAAQNTQSA